MKRRDLLKAIIASPTATVLVKKEEKKEEKKSKINYPFLLMRELNNFCCNEIHKLYISKLLHKELLRHYEPNFKNIQGIPFIVGGICKEGFCIMCKCGAMIVIGRIEWKVYK